MQRVVIDTSTLVGAVLHANSVPHRAWLNAQQTCEVLACRETFVEIETVLHRDRLNRYVDEVARDRFLEIYRISVEWIEVSQSDLAAVEPSCRDPRDDVFLALAYAGGANLIVSSDKDLLVMHPWRGIPILTPTEFLTQFSV
jgi:putative PIN family toxin of toxin-antitoxin system